MAVSSNRRMKLRVYFKDSPSPVDVSDVCHLGTEGELLRIVTGGGADKGGETQWWPLCHVFNIRMMERTEIPVV